MGSGDELAGTDVSVRRRVASDRHSCRAQPVDVGLEHRAVIVNEQVPAPVVAVAERSYQEGGHLPPGHVRVGAEAVVDRRVAAPE